MLVFNISKGLANAYYNNVQTGAPSASRLQVSIFNSTDTEAVLEAVENLQALKNLANTAEVTNSNYTRKNLASGDLAPLAPDHANNRQGFTIPDQTWTAVGAGDAWTHLCVAYVPDEATSTDSQIIVMTLHVFSVTPDGSDIIAKPGADGVFRARKV